MKEPHLGLAFSGGSFSRFPPSFRFFLASLVTYLVKLQKIMSHTDQSPLASYFLQPRKRNCRNPRACLICPNTGSLRSPCFSFSVATNPSISSPGTSDFPPSNTHCPQELLPVFVPIVLGSPRSAVPPVVYRWRLVSRVISRGQNSNSRCLLIDSLLLAT